MMDAPVLHHYNLGAGVVAFSSTRKGGVSQGNYSEFNINWYCGDSPEAIRANRLMLCRHLGIDEHRLVYPHQVHGTAIRAVDASFLSLAGQAREDALEGVDAVMTDLRGVCIGVSTADCIPVLLYDPQHHAVAAIHAGWRGTAARIVQHTLRAMESTYQTDAAHLRAVIGPGISLEHFEVGDEVYQQFEEAGFDMTPISRRYSKWHIDLWECNRRQLLDCGVEAGHIQKAGVCTYANAGMFFSARRLGIRSGRIFSAILQVTSRRVDE